MNYTNPFNDMLKNTFDYNQFLTTGRRNLEAASEASQAIVESAQAISRRGAEIARESVEGAMKASKDIFTSGTPETNIAKQTEFAKNERLKIRCLISVKCRKWLRNHASKLLMYSQAALLKRLKKSAKLPALQHQLARKKQHNNICMLK